MCWAYAIDDGVCTVSVYLSIYLSVPPLPALTPSYLPPLRSLSCVCLLCVCVCVCVLQDDAASAPAGSGSDGMAKPLSTGEGGAVTGYLTEIDPPAYSYNELLERAVDLLHQHNPEYSEKRRYNLKPPQLMKGRSRA
jgi:hypothetical protein